MFINKCLNEAPVLLLAIAADYDSVRFKLFIAFLVILLLSYVIGRYWALPWIAARWPEVSPEQTDPARWKELKQLAAYINQAAQFRFRLDPLVEGVPQRTTFRATLFGPYLRIVSKGFDQGTIHDFLDELFANMEASALVIGLQTGLGHTNSYFADWRLIQRPRYGVPQESAHFVRERRAIMRHYGELLAEELQKMYTNKSQVNFSIDTSEGLLRMYFSPNATDSDYFGIKDMPSDSSRYVRRVMIEEQARLGPYANKFSFVKYQKNSQSQVSNLIIKYDLQEDGDD